MCPFSFVFLQPLASRSRDGSPPPRSSQPSPPPDPPARNHPPHHPAQHHTPHQPESTHHTGKWKERATQLSSCALVSRSWHHLAQAELFMGVVLVNRGRMVVLAKLFGTRRRKDLARLVRAILLVEGANVDVGRVARDVVRHCTSLKHIWTESILDLHLEERHGLPPYVVTPLG